MCRWYCTSEGPSTDLKCKSCGCHYCGACLHGDAGKMRSLVECARCHQKPTVVPAGRNASWQCVAAAPDNVDFSAEGLAPSSGAHSRVGGVSANGHEYSSMCRTPDAPTICTRATKPVARTRSSTPNRSNRNSTPLSNAHPDKADRVKMVCAVCGYKSFPQWLNDQAHCLKCDAVLKTRPSCQQRRECGHVAVRRARGSSCPSAVSAIVSDSMSNAGASAPAPKTQQHPDTADRAKMVCHVCGYKCYPQWMNDQAHCLKCDAVLKRRPDCHQRSGVSSRPGSAQRLSLRAQHGSANLLDHGHDGDQNELAWTSTPPSRSSSVPQRSTFKGNDELAVAPLPNLLRRSSSRAQHSDAKRMIGPERFFYDKGSYTGTHSCGGPDRVPKGRGSSGPQFWARGNA